MGGGVVCGLGHGQTPICEWRVEPGKVNGKNLQLCGISLTCVLCFSSMNKVGRYECH